MCVCINMTIDNACLPVQFLQGPLKAPQGVTIIQSSVSVCDLIGPAPKETIRPDKAGSTYVTIIAVKIKYRGKREGSERKHAGETLQRKERVTFILLQNNSNLLKR